jgi:hypothetical protein
MTDIFNFIKDVGFPIFVAVYYMWRLDKRLHGIQKALESGKCPFGQEGKK